MYNNINEITLSDLKKNHTIIHYFGLGFIQVKLEKEFRIHFYTEKLPPIIDKEDVHNHRYGFTSTILYGELCQETFQTTGENTHTISSENCQEGYESQEKDTPCGLEKLSTKWFKKGDSYSIEHATFHRVQANNTITILKRGEYQKDFAQIIRPKEALKICPFSKKIDKKELWKIVEECLLHAQEK